MDPAHDFPTQPPLLVVLYDSDCGFCRATVGWLRRRDQRDRLEFVALQHVNSRTDPWRAALLGHDLRSQVHVVDLASGRVAEGGPAMLAILRALPRWALVARLAGARPLAPLVDLVYGLVAGHRNAFGRLVGAGGPSCQLPPAGRGSAP
jgi:predicted DCC family thiol-disulfide oxidoreductase YuxK